MNHSGTKGSRASAPTFADDAPTRARADELEQSLLDANEELARRTDELDAARQINRELMARLNRERR